MSNKVDDNQARALSAVYFSEENPKAVFACVTDQDDKSALIALGDSKEQLNLVMTQVCRNPELAAWFILGNDSMLEHAKRTLALDKVASLKDEGEEQDD